MWVCNVHWPMVNLGLVLFLGWVWLIVVTAHRRFIFEIGCVFYQYNERIDYNWVVCYKKYSEWDTLVTVHILPYLTHVKAGYTAQSVGDPWQNCPTDRYSPLHNLGACYLVWKRLVWALVGPHILILCVILWFRVSLNFFFELYGSLLTNWLT